MRDGLGSTVLPMWVLYGLFAGAFVPGWLDLPLWAMFPGIPIGCGVFYLLDQWLRTRHARN